MRDGYYLSTYLHIDSISHLLKVTHRHDHNLSLFYKSGNHIELIKYWELERVTGRKQHDLSLYDKEEAVGLINHLLKPLGLTMDDMVEIWGTPLIQTCEDYHSLDAYPHMAYHNLCHLFSSVLSDTELFYEHDILAMAVDTAPDAVATPLRKSMHYYAGAFIRKGQPEIVPIESPGIWWGLAAGHFKKREGTLMALAAASRSRLMIPYRPNITFVPDDKRSYGAFVKHQVINEVLEHVERCVKQGIGVGFNEWDERFTQEENRISMAMKEIQQITIAVMEQQITALLERFHINPETTYLAVAGGYALNCPTNTHLMQKFSFKGFIAPPCVNDSGLSLGIGLYAFYKKMLPEAISFKLKHSYYGNDSTIANAEVFENYQSSIESITDLNVEQVVDDLIEGPIAWFQGRSEIGPRALGHRSILGDPRSLHAKQTINLWKQREWWRPVAPIVMEQFVGQWFEQDFPSPFMLHAFTAREEIRERIPAVLHLDQSARVQTVNPDDRLLYQVLHAFREKTGVPMICNSSLNDKGEPIVDRVEEAIGFCLRKGVRVLYMNDKRIAFRTGCTDSASTSSPEPRVYQIGTQTAARKRQLLDEMNPHGLPVAALIFLKETLEYETGRSYDLYKKEDVTQILKAENMFKAISTYKKGIEDFLNRRVEN